MNQNENEKKEIKNSVLFENEEYNKAIKSLKEIIADKDGTIETLSNQIGEKDQIIISQSLETDREKTARIEAESKLAEKKDLKVESKGNYFKTEEEKFAYNFEKA